MVGFSIGKIDFSVYNVVKCYDTVLLQEFKMLYPEKNSDRMCKIRSNSFLTDSQT